MKFTKDEACKELAAKIPQKGQTLNLSERSISEQVEKLLTLIANDETELSDFVEKVLPILRTADANVRNDVSTGIKNYKDNNPLPPKKDDQEKTKNDNDDDALAKLLARIDALEKENSDNKKKNKLTERRSEITAKLKAKGVKDDEWISSFLDEVSLDADDFNVDAKVESYLKVYNKTESKIRKNATPGSGGGKREGEDKELDDILNKAAQLKNGLVFEKAEENKK